MTALQASPRVSNPSHSGGADAAPSAGNGNTRTNAQQLKSLPPAERAQALAKATDGDIQQLAQNAKNLSHDQRRDVFNTLAEGASGKDLARIASAFNSRQDTQLLAESIASKASSQSKQDFIQAKSDSLLGAAADRHIAGLGKRLLSTFDAAHNRVALQFINTNPSGQIHHVPARLAADATSNHDQAHAPSSNARLDRPHVNSVHEAKSSEAEPAHQESAPVRVVKKLTKKDIDQGAAVRKESQRSACERETKRIQREEQDRPNPLEDAAAKFRDGMANEGAALLEELGAVRSPVQLARLFVKVYGYVTTTPPPCSELANKSTVAR